MKRRDFLQLIALQGAALALASCAHFTSGTRRKSYYLTSPYLEDNGRLLIFDTAQRSTKWVNLELRYAHGYAQNPLRPSHVICISPKQTQFTVVDFERAEVVAKPKTKEGNRLVAHAVFSPDGQIFYTGEMRGDSGVIGIYDAKTYSRIGEIPSHGGGPHDMVMLSASEILVSDYAENYKASSLLVLDTRSGEKKLAVPSPKENQQWGHLAKIGSRVFVNSQHFVYKNKEKFDSFMKLGQPWEANKWRTTFASPSFVYSNGSVEPISFDPHSQSWSQLGFSTGVSGNGKLVASTFGLNNALGIYSLSPAALEKKIDFSAGPQGVSPSWENGFLVSTSDRKLWQVEPPSYSPLFVTDLPVGDHSALFFC